MRSALVQLIESTCEVCDLPISKLVKLKPCRACGTPVPDQRQASLRYCGNACRQRAYRERRMGER